MNLYSQNTIKFLLQKTLNSISELAYVALLLRPRERLQSIVMSTSVCVCVPVGLSVCLFVREYISGSTRGIFTSFMHFAYGRGSVLLRRRCDTLRTFGFTDDVMLFIIGHIAV